ncbi:MAG: c-type cytochrome [Steroidobacteraceae bacterium]
MKSTKIKMTVLAVAASAAISLLCARVATAQDASAEPEVAPAEARAAEYQAITTCRWCHGPGGNSISPIYPALAGQKAWYLREQLHAFKEQTRRDPYARGIMWGMAAQLTDERINALAEYFSKQTPPFASKPAPFQGSMIAAAAQQGRSIYNDGVAAKGVPPCSACHQADAAGNDQFPRLAGQHALYTIKQLIALHGGSREQVVMNGVAAPLERSDMKAVAYYLETLR